MPGLTGEEVRRLVENKGLADYFEEFVRIFMEGIEMPGHTPAEKKKKRKGGKHK